MYRTLLLLNVIAVLFYGCNKCKADLFAGDYAVSGVGHVRHLTIDSNGVHPTDTTFAISDTISFTELDKSTLVEAGNGAGGFSYNKENSNNRHCCFINLFDDGMVVDTVWFEKNSQHALKRHASYSDLTQGSETTLSGYKID